MPRRTNLDKTLVVSTAIRTADLGFPKNAAELCETNDIPFDVAYRVIFRPHQRRLMPAKKKVAWLVHPQGTVRFPPKKP